MADVLKKVPVREQDPKVRATNFDEVCLGYNKEEAMAEAERCLHCKNAKCVQGCPVNINIPDFIAEVKTGNFEGAYKVISESSALPAICGRVCPPRRGCRLRKCAHRFFPCSQQWISQWTFYPHPEGPQDTKSGRPWCR